MTLLVQTSIRAAVHPIDVLGRRVEALSATSLSTRLDRNVPKELRPLVEQLNGLLARLEEAFRRERQLTSDVAHELRTPVAELRSIAEVGGRWPESRDEVVAFFKDVHDVAMHMERLIADLLALARYEGGLEAIRWEPVVLLEELGEVRAHLEGRAVQRNVAIVVEGEGPAEVWTDRAKLEVILRNLLQNAIEHSPQGSTVRCRIIAEPGSARLVVANPAPALEPQDLPRMFDRFWRKEASRTGESNAGLGLALVRAFADLLGLDVRPTLGGDHTLSMMVTFSSRRPEPAAAPA
ncbi:MAG: ATP-binding protein [Acidobacteriota bacterium]